MGLTSSLWCIATLPPATAATAQAADVGALLTEGDQAFGRGEYNAAIRLYSSAIGGWQDGWVVRWVVATVRQGRCRRQACRHVPCLGARQPFPPLLAASYF